MKCGCSFGADVVDDGIGSADMLSVEYSELPDELCVLLSRFNLPRRLKIDLPNSWTLSGRSRDGMLLAVDLPDDLRESVRFSSVCSHEGRSEPSDRRDPEADEAAAWWCWCC